MNKEILTIACYQQSIVWERPEENRRRVAHAFSALASEADMLVVPETFTTGFSDSMAAMAESPGGPTLCFAKEMARLHDALFVGTWTVRDGGQVANRLHWVSPDGSWGYYDKRHTFRMSCESAQVARGTKREIFEWRGWHVKPCVCYDLRFPTWLRNNNPPDYDLLLVCANWPSSRRQAWDTLLRARAIENLCYVAGVNRVGVDDTGIAYPGHSVILDYTGRGIVRAADGIEDVIVSRLSKPDLDSFRQRWPFYLDFD